MKNLTHFFNYAANAPQNTGGGNSHFFMRLCKSTALLLLALTLGVGNVWGDDFSATEISTSGTTKNHVTCKSTAGSATNKSGCSEAGGSYVSTATVSLLSGDGTQSAVCPAVPVPYVHDHYR